MSRVSGFSFRSVRARLTTWFLVSGLVPLGIVGAWSYERSVEQLVNQQGLSLEMAARAAIDKIDRNLFERYGDVQAFTASPLARGKASEVTEAANLFTKLYGVYDLMIVADRDGTILATNSVAHDGRPIDTSTLIGRNVKGQEWFDKTVAGQLAAGETH